MLLNLGSKASWAEDVAVEGVADIAVTVSNSKARAAVDGVVVEGVEFRRTFGARERAGSSNTGGRNDGEALRARESQRLAARPGSASPGMAATFLGGYVPHLSSFDCICNSTRLP